MTTTTALVVSRHGGPEVLEVQEREVPTPGPGEALVEVAAGGVNFIDAYQRAGTYPTQPPYVQGFEAAGTVRAIGDGAVVAVGDRVAWSMTIGLHAGLVIADSEKLLPVPDGVDLETAAAATLQGMTAHALVTDVHHVTQGTVALVHAAAGGVGQLLTQMIVSRGGHVIATAGSAAKLEIARSRGAAETIDYSEADDLSGAVRQAAERLGATKGVDVAYDGVGKATFDDSLASLRPRGTMVLFGGASGQVPPFDLQRLNSGGSLFVTRPSLAHFISEREELMMRGRELFAEIDSGTLDIAIGGRFGLDRAAEAYRALEGRASTGKLLLIP
ncbi:quinone oxidoreductase family protein [Janibacter cremeus]|uniref:NADPH2:quinone reductase n=1 Tax=Janibacter cremeus TaxID=1285192 RepID=A0A852VWF7_9MICO|nr:quinone oxidoreductase [Janibacter cremeus]NYF98983.1 NADPH2:quinone reductase [Janibacter cremeus]